MNGQLVIGADMSRQFISTLLCGLLIAAATSAQAAEKLQTIQAVIHTEEWKGWGNGEPLPDSVKSLQIREKFTRVAADASKPQVFSGKVLDLKPEQKAEIGIVSLIGTHWINNSNYEWFPLDKSMNFSVTSAFHPDAPKALVVRAEGRPWTFLRAQFDPREGATDIELHVKPAVKCVITMEDAQGNAVSSFRGEIFNAYVMTDDAGKEIDAERFGHPASSGGAMPIDLPPEPVGILLEAGPTVAPYYSIIDPREANHFHFKMLAASRIRGVVTRDGKPAANVGVYNCNNAAPLSATNGKTDASGRFNLAARVPGQHYLEVGTYKTTLDLKPGEIADLKIDLSAAP